MSLILAVLMALSTGMGVGSLHNAQVRGALPGFFTPFGFALIALTVIGFLAALLIARWALDTDSVARKWVVGSAIYLVVIEGLNLITTVMSEGAISGWLFHEYLGVAVAPVLLVWVMMRKA